ncbi:MAG TPA: TorF family putative porin [Telluria sp.]|nr:TorF family putative porin [Telluria sp.]
MRGGVLAILLCAAPLASAQTTFTVGATSDYRVRGLTYSGGSPSVSAGVNRDFDSGWYAGGTAARARVPNTGVNAVGQVYAGYAARLNAAVSWEAGAARTVFHGGSGIWNYGEVYAGVALERIGARLYYSPHYYGSGEQAWYGEVNGTWPLSERWDVTAHAGRLRTGETYAYGRYTTGGRTDLRLGLTWTLDAWSAWAAWSDTRGNTAGRPARGLAIGLTRVF